MDKNIKDEIDYATHEYSLEKLDGFLLGLVVAKAISSEERDRLIEESSDLKEAIYPTRSYRG